MTWIPTKGNLLGEIISGDYSSPGGILVVNSLKTKKPRKVRILAVGKDAVSPCGVKYEGQFLNDKGDLEVYRAKPGDVAYFKLAQGQKVKIDGKECLILENHDIVAVEDNV